jgi:hypothetical protein
MLCLAVAVACLGREIANAYPAILRQPIAGIAVLVVTLLSYLAIERGLSPLAILYVLTAGSLALMI